MPDKAIKTLILRDELADLWREQDVFTLVQQMPGQIAREVQGRETRRVDINQQIYYRKLHTGVGWPEIFASLVRGRLPIIGARNEWQALERLAELNIPSLKAVAFGEKYYNPAKQLSFIITRELADTIDLDRYLLASQAAGKKLSFKARKVLLQHLAEITKTMHQGGINHRDFYLCHFMLANSSITAWEAGLAAPQLYLVDLHRAQLRQAVPFRWQVKDLASLYFSAMDLGVTKRDVFRFMRVYLNVPLRQMQAQQQGLLLACKRRAEQLYAREQRLKARGDR